MTRTDWFERLTGFRELSYDETRKRLEIRDGRLPTLIAAEPVSAYDAKTHLPSLLERTARGERFVITRHGKPVAQLIPFDPDTYGNRSRRVSSVGVALAGRRQ